MSKPEDVEWTTRDGEVVKVGEMAPSHLMNTIRFLERQEVGNMVRAREIIKGAHEANSSEYQYALRVLAKAELKEKVYLAMRSVAAKRGWLMPDGRTPTPDEEWEITQAKLRQQEAADKDEAAKAARRGGERPIEVD